jgi:L-fuculose-phosphate aldolase
MHLAAYHTRPETLVILHVHPPKAISLGLLNRSLPAITPDFYLHLGSSVPLLPYTTPTTEKLGRSVGRLLRLRPALLLQNHGVLVTGRDVQQALLRLFLIEEHAAIYLDALAAGRPRLLSPIDMRQLDEVTGGRYKR